jgi:DNA-binding winged helix-turn-helix (wHTH) protein
MDISSARTIYFDQFEIDLDRRMVLRAGEMLPLNPKAFDLLLALIEQRGSAVSKDELLDRVWPGQFVEENNLTVHVSALRKLFGEKKNEHRYIITVPGRGYKFIGELREPVSDTLPAPVEPPRDLSDQHTAFDAGARAERPDRRWLAAISLLSVLTLGAAGFFFWGGSEGSGDVPVRSIAILPFKPLVADARDEALELGISDSLISRFSRIPSAPCGCPRRRGGCLPRHRGRARW